MYIYLHICIYIYLHIYIYLYILCLHTYICIYKTDNLLLHTIILNHFLIKLKNFIIFLYASPTGSTLAVISICYIALGSASSIKYLLFT